MNKRKPITSASMFFRVTPSKYKLAVKKSVIDLGYTDALGHLGLSTHLYESFGIWVTGPACEELIEHYLGLEKKKGVR